MKVQRRVCPGTRVVQQDKERVETWRMMQSPSAQVFKLTAHEIDVIIFHDRLIG